MENLLRALTTKLDLCARLSVFEYEAESDGYPATADAFRSLAATEREAFRELLLHLRRHLDDPSLLNLEAPGVASDIDSSPGSKDRSER